MYFTPRTYETTVCLSLIHISCKSTLDETREADLLLHVVDISHPDFEEQFLERILYYLDLFFEVGM